MRPITLALAAAVATTGTAWARGTALPFVGCRADGQTGPLQPPKDKGDAPRLPAAAASRLAWYVGGMTGGVTAPRGWRCLELYGSNGSVLMVTPGGFGRDPFMARLSGPAVQLSVSLAETSGRFEAAKIAARLFPNRRAFVEGVIGEGLEPRGTFVFGAFPHDRVVRLSRDAVAFKTPAGEDGVGTMSRLVKSGDPIHGLASMDADDDATLLVVRLPPTQADLAGQILDVMKPHRVSEAGPVK